jgi:predicted transcriptional regulator
MAKAIVGISDWSQTKSDLQALARAIDAGEALPEADYRLNFASPEQLFAELTPARLRLLDTLKATGSLSIQALAKRLGQGDDSVRKDLDKLLEHDLIEQDAEGRVFVPWDAIRLDLTLDGSRAA